MDVHDKLDDLTALVESARSMPMSASCIVNRGEVLALLDEMRAELPEEFDEAERILREREGVLDQARAEVTQRARAAHDLLDPLPHGPAREALEDLCDSVVTRTA